MLLIILRKYFNETKINDLNLIKTFTEMNIYTDYMSLHNMESIHKERQWKYAPKTLILFDDNEIFNDISMIFKEEYSTFLRLSIWAVFEESDIKNVEKKIYIPYDCQFFVIKPEKNDGYQIFEYFNMKINQRNFYVKEFGNWDEITGLTVPVKDFYQRRLDMNQTVMEMAYKDLIVSKTVFSVI